MFEFNLQARVTGRLEAARGINRPNRYVLLEACIVFVRELAN